MQEPILRSLCNYSAGVVKIYDATNSVARFLKKKYCFLLQKRSSPLQPRRCGCKFKSHRIGSSSFLTQKTQVKNKIIETDT
jgi:hypothetical protein